MVSLVVLIYGTPCRPLSLADIVLRSLERQGEIGHRSHCIHIRFLVVHVSRGLASEQARKVVLACLRVQQLPLIALPHITKNQVLPRL